MTFTEVIQTKLNELGFKNEVNGYITPKTDLTSPTRLAFIELKKTTTGFPLNAYIDLNVLKMLDQKYYKKFPDSTLPKSAVAGWSTSLKYMDRPNKPPVVIPTIVKPDDLYNNSVIPADTGMDKKKIMYIGAVALIAFYFLKMKKKKRR